MNDHDKRNLSFLMNVSDEGLRLWASQASLDDMDYAMELVKSVRKSLEEASTFIDLEPEDLTDASQVISRFRLSK